MEIDIVAKVAKRRNNRQNDVSASTPHRERWTLYTPKRIHTYKLTQFIHTHTLS